MTLRPAEVDLDQAIKAEVELLKSALPDAQITYESSGSLMGWFDENRIREALANLVSNAAQYRLPGTPVDIRATSKDGVVVLSVCNQGAPIAPEVLETYFEPLRRREVTERHAPRRNLGIGLFIVREIARAHGGTVSAEASGGKVSFVIQLPRQPGGSTRPAPGES